MKGTFKAPKSPLRITELREKEILNLVPPLTKEEYEALKASINEHGVLVPIVQDEKGEVIDGQHRLAVCKELGITSYPTITQIGLDCDGKLEMALKLNLQRRHIDRETLKEIALAIRTKRGWTQERIAKALGISQRTVAYWLNEFSNFAKLPSIVIGKDEKKYPAVRRPRQIYAANRKESNQALGIAQSQVAERVLPDRPVTIQQAIKLVKKEETIARQQLREALANQTIGPSWTLLTGDCFQVDIPVPVDAIITDPPYGREFIGTYHALGEVALKYLPDSGNCIVMVGQSWLPYVLSILSEYLDYQWTLAYLTPSPSTQAFYRHVRSNWKPVLRFSKGINTWKHVEDVLISNERTKDWHEWEQSISGMTGLVERFTVKGQTILDPFCGTGTTGIAALRLGRRFVGIDCNAKAIAIADQRIRSEIS